MPPPSSTSFTFVARHNRTRDSLNILAPGHQVGDTEGNRIQAQRIGNDATVATSFDGSDALTAIEIAPAGALVGREWLETLDYRPQSPEIGVAAFLVDMTAPDAAIFAFTDGGGNLERIQIDPMVSGGSMWALLSGQTLVAIEVLGAAQILARFRTG